VFSSMFNTWYFTTKIGQSNNKQKCQTANGSQEASTCCGHLVEDHNRKNKIWKLHGFQYV